MLSGGNERLDTPPARIRRSYLEQVPTDILVVGGGAAGCFAAIMAKESGAGEVLLVDKGYVGMSGCSKFAAGSFKCFVPGEDSYDLWFGKAVEEGCYINDQKWTQIHLEEVFERARDLEKWGLHFLKDEQGKYDRLEGQGSSEQRPIKTMMFEGPLMMDVLRKAAREHSVKIMDKTMITHLLHDRRDSRRIAGALGFDTRTGENRVFKAKATVLTAGAQAFKSHYAYQKMVTGDAHIMGLRAGAALTNYEFTCHHLSCAHFDTTGMNVLQGSGARFVNSLGEPYMNRYDPEYGDHACMNRLSAGMACEVALGRGPLYYDFSAFDERKLAYFKKTLPIMYQAFERAGFIRNGRIRERVEWVSVNMGNVGYGGGLKISTDCETDLKGLYAAGDATCGPASGVEGFCAYAIPFAVTSGARSGKAASVYIRQAGDSSLEQDEIRSYQEELFRPLKITAGVEPDYVVLKVQEILFPSPVYLLRHGERLERALDQIRQLKDHAVPALKAYDPHYLRMAVEASHMVTCAEMFLLAALTRTESRGSHLREDYPETDNVNWLRWIMLRQREGKLTAHTEDIPIHTYPLKPERMKSLHPVAAVLRESRKSSP
jgi:succinate dehydrogenase/fumarate reductase flavoprotein subunit